MERIELAVAGLQQALRARSPRGEIPRIGRAHDQGAADLPAWWQLVRQQVPYLLAGLGAEHHDPSSSMPARSRMLHAERQRLITRLHSVLPLLEAGPVGPSGSWDDLRRTLLRLVRDIGHHHQRVNDLLYDESWLDVGGSE